MKDSAYNIFSTDADGKSLVFNAYTRRFFRVSEKNTHRLREIIADIDRYADVWNMPGYVQRCVITGLLLMITNPSMIYCTNPLRHIAPSPRILCWL